MIGRGTKVNALWLAAAGAAVLVAVSTLIMPAPAPPQGGEPDQSRLTAGALFEDRYREVIDALAAGPRGEWAGKYQCRDGAASVSLYLSPSDGFVWRAEGPDWFRNGKGYGSAAAADGRLRLRVEQALAQPDPAGRPASEWSVRGCLGEELYSVRWGGRHYLVPSDRMINFCEVYNSGRVDDLKQFLLKEGDEEQNVAGRPEVPEEYSRFINRSRLLQ